MVFWYKKVREEIMQALRVAPKIHYFDTFKEFNEEFKLGKNDLLVTNEFIYEPYVKPLGIETNVIFQEKFGQGEPSDEMIDNMKKEMDKFSFDRIVAFGGGTMYSCGEDSLFSRTLGKFKIKRLMAADQIGVNTHKESTWFKGYTEKYVFDKGAYCKAANPKIWNILKYYYIFQEYKKIKMPLWKIVKLYNNGAKAYKSSLSYDEFYQSEKEKICKH